MLFTSLNASSAEPDSSIRKNSEPNAIQLVDALNGTFGTHSGFRASHAKGFFAEGAFYPTNNASELVAGDFFKNKKLTSIFRFSIGGGNPNVSDKSRTVRGMAVQISSDAEQYDLVLISEPAFFAATPESFVSFLKARIPDSITKKPDPAKIAAHIAQYPEGKIQPTLLASHPAPYSYATTPYFSNHAFKFQGSKNSLTTARILVEPLSGTQYLTEQQEKDMSDTFLIDEFNQRLAKGYIKYEVFAQLPDAGDSLSDPSQVWSGQKRIKLGELHVEKILQAENYESKIFFPLQLPQNIQGTNDPILNARAAAYVVSLSRRQQK